MPDSNRFVNCGTLLPVNASAGECSEYRLRSGKHDSADASRHNTKFRIRRLSVLAVLLWLLGVLLLYVCSWPPYESEIPEDRKVVAISEDGRYFATVRSPAKLVRTIRGRVEYHADFAPRGPIETWDARGGTVIEAIDCGPDNVNTVHLMDRGNLVVASFSGEPSLPKVSSSYVSAWKKGTTHPLMKPISGRLHSCADVDGNAIAVVLEDFSNMAKVVEVRSGNELSQLGRIHPGEFIKDVILSPNGTRIVTKHTSTEVGYTMRVWETITGNQIGFFREPNWFHTWSMSPDGTTLWIVDWVQDQANMHASLHGWDIESQQLLTSITPPDKSPSHAILRSAQGLVSLTPPFLKVTASGPALIRVNDESIDVVDANLNGDLFTKDGLLQAALKYDFDGEPSLIVRRMEDRSEIFRLPARGALEGFTPDMRYLAFQKIQSDGISTLRERLSGLLHTPPQAISHSARDICAVDLRNGTSHLVGVLPRHRFKFLASDGFIDGGKRILVNNYIWEFPGHRPWAMILLLPLLVVAAIRWTVMRWRKAGA